MTTKEYSLIRLFKQFVKDSYKGKRLKPDGSKIRPQTVSNYEYVLKYLREYQELNNDILRIRIFRIENKKLFFAEKNYWKKFYLAFTNYLYTKKGCYDNYVGAVIKTIRIFFNYLNKEKGIITGNFHKSFFVCKEEVPIVTLLPGQLQFLINDKTFETNLSKSLQKSKSIFVFGCTVALRVSDMFSIKFTDIEQVGEAFYLSVKTEKTGKIVRIKLRAYAIEILEQFRTTAKKRKTVFPPIPRSRFNNNLKTIAELAGWTSTMGKCRRGIAYSIAHVSNQKQYHFPATSPSGDVAFFLPND